MIVNYRVILWHFWQFLTYWGTQIMMFVKVRWQLESDNGQFLQSLKMKRHGVPLLGRGQVFLVPPFFWSAVSKNWVKRRPNCRFQWSSTHLLHFYHLVARWMTMKENEGEWRTLKGIEGEWRRALNDNVGQRNPVEDQRKSPILCSDRCDPPAFSNSTAEKFLRQIISVCLTCFLLWLTLENTFSYI